MTARRRRRRGPPQEFIKRKGDQPDILHIHDWRVPRTPSGHPPRAAARIALRGALLPAARPAGPPDPRPPSAPPPRRHTAPVSMLYWEAYSKEIRKASVVLTVHNFAQPGECRLEARPHFFPTAARFPIWASAPASPPARAQAARRPALPPLPPPRSSPPRVSPETTT